MNLLIFLYIFTQVSIRELDPWGRLKAKPIETLCRCLMLKEKSYLKDEVNKK